MSVELSLDSFLVSKYFEPADFRGPHRLLRVTTTFRLPAGQLDRVRQRAIDTSHRQLRGLPSTGHRDGGWPLSTELDWALPSLVNPGLHIGLQ